MNIKSRREQIEAMLAEEPNDPELRYMQALEFVSAGDDANAAECLLALIQIAPNYPPAYHQAGRTLLRLDRMADAKAALSQGIPIAQKLGDMHAAGEMSELLQSME